MPPDATTADAAPALPHKLPDALWCLLSVQPSHRLNRRPILPLE